mmetsp:Transcript_52725/g.140669  ORF Transcript_52725/g.140669 Transcript_52725/m.140669 type:complete len:143 (+) Transcript_52725:1600-2028(+)
MQCYELKRGRSRRQLKTMVVGRCNRLLGVLFYVGRSIRRRRFRGNQAFVSEGRSEVDLSGHWSDWQRVLVVDYLEGAEYQSRDCSVDVAASFRAYARLPAQGIARELSSNTITLERGASSFCVIRPGSSSQNLLKLLCAGFW